jgi:hypothetical protein
MPLTNLSPMTVLRDAIKAVPAVKWALGVGGVLAAVALVYMFKLDARAAFVGLVLLFCFMGVLVVFARASALRSGAIFWPAMIFTWFVLIMFMATTVSLFTSVFFSKPLDLQDWLTGKPAAAAVQPSSSELSHAPADERIDDNILGQLVGQWRCVSLCAFGSSGARFRRSGDQLVVINEVGATSRVRIIANNNKIVSIIPVDWGNFQGTLADNGKMIFWANAGRWAKVE